MLHRFPIVLASFTFVCFVGCVDKAEDPAKDSTLSGKSQAPVPSKKNPAEKNPAEKNPAEKNPAEKAPTKKDAEKTDAEKKAPDAGTQGDLAGRLDEKVYDHFGAGVVAEGDNLTVADLVSKSDDLAGKKVRLTGKVQAVCKAKGCWMFVTDGDKKVRIKFRDYGFFVPKDCEGREVVLEGTYSVSKTSVAELKHLLEDEGKTEEAKKVTEPLLEMKVMADGVAMKKK